MKSLEILEQQRNDEILRLEIAYSNLSRAYVSGRRDEMIGAVAAALISNPNHVTTLKNGIDKVFTRQYGYKFLRNLNWCFISDEDVKLNVEGTKINIIRASAGAITESDVLLANASHALIYGFNVRPDSNVRNKAIEEKVEIRLHRIIYALIEELESMLKGMRAKKEVEQYLGQAEVRQVFKASKIGTIAGCYVVDGEITSTSLLRVLRDGEEVYNGKINGLKRFKDDVKEVKSGFECGISILNFNDIHEGDIIEAYKMVEEEDNGR